MKHIESYDFLVLFGELKIGLNFQHLNNKIAYQQKITIFKC